MQDVRKQQEKDHARVILGSEDRVLGWSGPAGQARLERRTALAAEKACLDEEKLVIELGCGTGSSSALWWDRCGRLVALDISEMLIRAGRERGSSAAHVTADAEQLPFEEGCADAVIGNSVLHHLDVDAAFSEIRRVLKHGGRFAFAEPNMLNPQIAIQKNIPFIKRLVGDTPGERAFVRFSLSRKLRVLGFGDVEVVPFDFLHPSLPAKLIPVFGWAGRVIERIPVVREAAGSLLISGRKP